MTIASRTPDGKPNRCPTCGKDFVLAPSYPYNDAPCPHCGSLVVFAPKRQCPKCGSRNVAVVLWGPEGNSQLSRLEEQGILALYGGETTPANRPGTVCLKCSPEWITIHSLAMQEMDYDVMASIAAGTVDELAAAELREVKKNVSERLRQMIADICKGVA
jgi:DNA-directed RNA polymerase subunit RPC12/RpoP